MKKMVKDLELNEKVDSLFAVKYKRPLRQYKNGFMFTLGLSDKTGEVDATYWGDKDRDAVKALWDSFDVDEVVRVKGVVTEFKNKQKIDVNKGTGKIEKVAEFDFKDFVASTEKNLDEMEKRLDEKVASVKNPFLKKLLDSFFGVEDFKKKFKKAPGAMYIHHGYIGGLMEHTLNVTDLCEKAFELYPSMDRDLLVTGALLHDVGKMRELVITGTSIKVSEEGMLRGHIIIGEEMVLEHILKISGFPEVLKFKVLHVLLSHHGNGEYGSPKEPQFAEAAAVHWADAMDSQIAQYVSIRDETDSTDFRIYTKRLGELYLK
jgi:3'-5' exoribonuclease